jgi:hypothetical protein
VQTTSIVHNTAAALAWIFWGERHSDVVDDVSQCQVFRIEMSPFFLFLYLFFFFFSFVPSFKILFVESFFFPIRAIKRNRIKRELKKKGERRFGSKDKRQTRFSCQPVNWADIPTTACLSHKRHCLSTRLSALLYSGGRLAFLPFFFAIVSSSSSFLPEDLLYTSSV